MNENKSKDKYRTMAGLIMLLSLLIGLVIGVVLGIQLYNVTSTKVGFWEGSVEDTDIVILTLIHQIRSSSKIRTVIEFRNTGDEIISCNCTLYYTSSVGVDLATWSFNATIDTGEEHNEAFMVEPIDVNQWAGTDISIFEY